MSFFLLYDANLHGEKIEKTDDPEILHCRQMGNGKTDEAKLLGHSC